MNPEAVARAYVSCIELEERLRLEAPGLADQMAELRSDLHALLLQTFKDAGIPFADRAEAARLAFELTQKTSLK